MTGLLTWFSDQDLDVKGIIVAILVLILFIVFSTVIEAIRPVVVPAVIGETVFFWLTFISAAVLIIGGLLGLARLNR